MGEPGVVSVYTPAAKLRRPGALFREMTGDMKRAGELGWRLAQRDIRARYRQSYFGLAWAFLPPLVTASIFIFLNNQNVIQVPATDVPYPVFVLVGTMLWQLFVDSLNTPLTGFNAARPMLAQTRFPREAILISGIAQVLFNLGIRVVILAAVFVVFRIPVTWAVFPALFATLMLILLGISLGLFLMPLGMLYTDVAQGLTMVTTLWFFLTPVVYPLPREGALAAIGGVNPVTPLLVAARDLATTGALHDPGSLLLMSGLVILASLVGWFIMHLALPIVVERMGA